MAPAIVDQFGRQVQAKPIDTWEARAGVAACLFHMASLVAGNIEDLFRFYVPMALNDRHHDVRSEMLRGATATIDIHGRVTIVMYDLLSSQYFYFYSI
jgi:hypothetical protein